MTRAHGPGAGGGVEELGNLGAEPAPQAFSLSLGKLLVGELIEAGAGHGGYFNSQDSHNKPGCLGGVQMQKGEHILGIYKTPT